MGGSGKRTGQRFYYLNLEFINEILERHKRIYTFIQWSQHVAWYPKAIDGRCVLIKTVAFNKIAQLSLKKIRIYLHLYIYVCIYFYTDTWIYIHIFMYIYFIYKHIYTYVGMYTYLSLFSFGLYVWKFHW